MTTIELVCRGASARARVSGPITAGMVGIPVEIRCDSAWDGLTKTLVCMSARQKIPLDGVEDSAVVAWEVLTEGMHLYLGLEGRSPSGDVVIPTTWADCGRVEPGAEGSHTGKPTPTEMEQLLEIAANTVLVQQEQPDVPGNRLWVREETEEFAVPEWEDLEALRRRVEQLEARLNAAG